MEGATAAVGRVQTKAGKQQWHQLLQLQTQTRAGECERRWVGGANANEGRRMRSDTNEERVQEQWGGTNERGGRQWEQQ